ncbi:MAG: potassium transporter TrkG [Hyphomonas sp.]|jgi:Trk-type K+ transport system membrane component
MNYASVARVLGLLMLFAAAAAALGALVALLAGETAQLIAFSVTALGITVAASSVLLLTPKPRARARPSDGLAVVILWWLVTPVASALPFVFGVADNSVVAALHEAASCLTTTGHTVIRIAGGDWPVSLIYWRGALHLMGAYAAIVMAAGIFAAINLGGPGVHRTVLFTLPEGSFFEAMPRILWAAGLMMAATLAAVFIGLLLSGMAPGRAMTDAVSTVTTGLVDPYTMERGPGSRLAKFVLGFGLIASALGLAIWLPLRAGAWRSVLRDSEGLAFGLFILIFTAVAVAAGLNLADGLGWSVSTLSTSGLPLGDPQAARDIPLTVYVMPCLIGGSALAAAGGIKLARVIVLGRRAWQEFQQLGYRRSIVSFRFRDRELDERSVIGVWVYFVAYVLAVFLFLVAFSFAGTGFDDSVRLAIGGLTSSGGLLGGVAANLGPAGEIVLILAMLLGRLEILTLLPALSSSFWRG